MPTNPAAPKSNSSIERLNLSAANPRSGGSDPSAVAPWLNPGQCSCFEAEASAVLPCGFCFEVE